MTFPKINFQHFALLSCIFSLLALSFSSCTIEKRIHRPGYHIEWKKSPKSNQELSKLPKEKSEMQQVNKSTEIKNDDLEHKVTDNRLADDFLHASSNGINSVQFENSSQVSFIDSKLIYCDTLVLNDMTKMAVNLVEIGIHELKFKDCGRSVGKTFTISKSEVTRIIYPDGTDEQIYYDESIDTKKSNDRSRKINQRGSENVQNVRSPEVVGIFSLIFGLFANFSAAIALYVSSNALVFTIMALIYGILALTTGIVSLTKIGSSPDNYSGRGAAILGLILGILNIVFAILVFTTVIVLLSL